MDYQSVWNGILSSAMCYPAMGNAAFLVGAGVAAFSTLNRIKPPKGLSRIKASREKKASAAERYQRLDKRIRELSYDYVFTVGAAIGLITYKLLSAYDPHFPDIDEIIDRTIKSNITGSHLQNNPNEFPRNRIAFSIWVNGITLGTSYLISSLSFYFHPNFDGGREKYLQARKKEREQGIEAALEDFKECAKECPTMPKIFSEIASKYIKLGHTDQALEIMLTYADIRREFFRQGRSMTIFFGERPASFTKFINILDINDKWLKLEDEMKKQAQDERDSEQVERDRKENIAKMIGFSIDAYAIGAYRFIGKIWKDILDMDDSADTRLKYAKILTIMEEHEAAEQEVRKIVLPLIEKSEVKQIEGYPVYQLGCGDKTIVVKRFEDRKEAEKEQQTGINLQNKLIYTSFRVATARFGFEMDSTHPESAGNYFLVIDHARGERLTELLGDEKGIEYQALSLECLAAQHGLMDADPERLRDPLQHLRNRVQILEDRELAGDISQAIEVLFENYDEYPTVWAADPHSDNRFIDIAGNLIIIDTRDHGATKPQYDVAKSCGQGAVYPRNPEGDSQMDAAVRERYAETFNGYAGRHDRIEPDAFIVEVLKSMIAASISYHCFAKDNPDKDDMRREFLENGVHAAMRLEGNKENSRYVSKDSGRSIEKLGSYCRSILSM